MHQTRRLYHGWSGGRRILPREYQGEAETARQFFAKQLEAQHPAVLAAIMFFEKWLQAAREGLTVPGKNDMCRLSVAGVEPVDLLVESAAVFLFSHQKPSIIPDGRPLAHAIGTAVAMLTPRGVQEFFRNGEREQRAVRVLGPARRAIGTTVLRELGVLFLNMEKGIEAAHVQRAIMAQALHTPFIAA